MKTSTVLIASIFLVWGGSLMAASVPTTWSDVVSEKDSLTLAFPGKKGPADYNAFGKFEDLGTPHYRYTLTDRAGLASQVGEGIFPNTDVAKDPTYQQFMKEKKLGGNQWRFVDTTTPGLNFYKWATSSEDPGVKQYYSALMLERSGHIEDAVKGFYAMAVHYPRTSGFTYFGSGWSMGPAALDRVEELLRHHPSLGMRWTGGEIQVEGRYGKAGGHTVINSDPGLLVADPKGQVDEAVNLSTMSVIKTVAGPYVQLKQYSNHHWQLFVGGNPFMIKAVTYSVTPVGLSPDRGTWNVSKDWQLVDTNHNGLHDGFFESYVDTNGNGVRDADEPVVGDAQLLKDMGANTLRVYHHLYNKELFRKLYKDYGFYVLCGDVLGGYAVDSGADWKDGTDYRNKSQQKKMLASIRKMVEEYKDEPYILMWVIGNENVYGVGNNAGKDPEAFFELVDRAAKLIHQLDPSRPIALANGDLMYLDIIKEKVPHIDVMGGNVYRGEQGFGRSFFQDIRERMDKPVLITEFGAPAYAEGFSQKSAEAFQAMYLANNWEDLQAHRAGHGVGNALGAVLFEWTDEWWKANSDLPSKIQRERADWYAGKAEQYKALEPGNHDPLPQFGGPYLDGWSYEEWFGITSQGSGKGSPFARVLRPAYYRMKEVWHGDN